MTHSIFIETHAKRSLDKISRAEQNKIIRKIDSLAENPRPFGAIKLKNQNAWRIRIGNYRVIYEIEDKVCRIVVIEIGHRKNIYRDL